LTRGSSGLSFALIPHSRYETFRIEAKLIWWR
jgi:hypothetical protein